LLKKVNMEYKKVIVEDVLNSHCNFKIYKTNTKIDAEPGQFVFAWIPGVGEKPFSIMDDDPLTLGVLEAGIFTKEFNQLKKGDSFYIRGVYGQSVNVQTGSNVVLVGGGSGIAGIYLLAKKLFTKANIISLLAAKDSHHLPYLKEFEKYGKVRVATEDGSLGKKGLVTNLFEDLSLPQGTYFFNCGPKAMIDAVLPLELRITSPEKIFSSIDYMTKCGVGMCGSCADSKGRRTCVEGPFIRS
jgi:dihydroorotate dehydrogenase (NAD+) catalytic subunit